MKQKVLSFMLAVVSCTMLFAQASFASEEQTDPLFLEAQACIVQLKNNGLSRALSPLALFWSDPPFFGFSTEPTAGRMVFWRWKDKLRLVLFEPREEMIPDEEKPQPAERLLTNFLSADFPEIHHWSIEAQNKTDYTLYTHNDKGELLIQLYIFIDPKRSRITKVFPLFLVDGLPSPP